MQYNFVPENVELFSFKCNQHVLVEKEFIKYVRRFDDVTEEKHVPPVLAKPHPMVNSYYEFAEDYDAVNRIPHLLHELHQNQSSDKPSSSSFEVYTDTTSLAPSPEDKAQGQDYIVERKAQIAYLSTPPKCFVILGKPGLGEERLGKLLADYWHCVLITPEALIHEEIQSGSRAGQCIEFNLRCGRSISVDVIIRLLQKRLGCEAVKHCGFVLCGFPLIANDLFSDDPLSSESAIFNVREIFEEIIDEVAPRDTVKNVSRNSVVMEGATDEDREESMLGEWDYLFEVMHVKKLSIWEGMDIIPTEPEVICYASKNFDKDANQMEYILSLCSEFDYLIVYLKCSTEEVVKIRQDNRFNSQTGEQMSIQRERSQNMFSPYSSQKEEEVNLLFDDQIEFSQKMAKLQNDLPPHVMTQLERYLRETQLVIEKYILLKNPEDVIRLDGRMAPQRMFEVLRFRLKVLPYTPAVLPKMLATSNLSFADIGEDYPVPSTDDAIAEIATEEIYYRIRGRKCLGPLYQWNLSVWKYMCPVAMKEGHITAGLAKYAVHFMNNIFFLSTEVRCARFLENPRPFLLPPMPMSLRKVFIIGPVKSGKTTIAKCIQQFNHAKILEFRAVMRKCGRAFMSETLHTAREDAIEKALEHFKELRRNAYLNQEEKRLKMVKHYLDCIKENLIQLKDALQVMIEFDDLKFSLLPVPSGAIRTQSVADAESTLEKLAAFQQLLKIVTPEDCDMYLHNDDLILLILPGDFQPPLVFTFDVIGPSTENVLNYAEGLLEKAESDILEQSGSTEKIAFCINSALDDHNTFMANGRINGWIMDGFPPNSEVLRLIKEENIPDIVYLIVDSSSGSSLLTLNMQGTRVDPKSLAALFKESDVINTISSGWLKTPYFEVERDSGNIKAEIDGYLLEKVPDIELVLRDRGYNYNMVDVAGRSFDELLAEIVEDYKIVQQQQTRVVSTEEKLLEPTYYGESEERSGEYYGEDYEPHDNENFTENRRLGNTLNYDPVALAQYGVLWRGKEDNLVNYLNKMWLFATEETMGAFLVAPNKYSVPTQHNKCLSWTRICIAGNKSVGKTTQTRLLSKWIGLYYFGFVDELNKVIGEEFIGDCREWRLDQNTLKEIVFPFWQDPNKKAVGFVMNDFPRNVSDLQFMVDNFLIPDCVVQIHMEPEAVQERLMEKLLTEWRSKVGVEKNMELKNYEEQLEEWQRKRDIEKIRMLEARKQERFERKFYGETGESETESLLSYHSYQETQDEKDVEAYLQQYMLPPVLSDDWETEEEATERIRLVVREATAGDSNTLLEMRALAEKENIPWYVVDGNMNEIRVYNLIMQHVMPFIFRGRSSLERAYDISIEMAEKLLESGYYFLSRFGKVCPVQMYENYNPLPMYIKKESHFELFPLIHSNYIYFLAGLENREKFKKDILKYVLQDYTPMPLIRVRTAVVGPPHSGKTTLAERIASEYSLQHISVGKAVRRVLNYMPNSILAQKVRMQLRKGEELSDEVAMQCVEAMTFDAKAVAVGFVLDGIPGLIDQVKFLAQMNLVPHLIINLRCDLDYIYKYMNVFIAPFKPPYSKKFIKARYDDWLIDEQVFHEWLDKEYQNMVVVLVEPSRWKTWYKANEVMLSVINEIKHYYKNCNKHMALRVANMLVTPYEFITGQSSAFQHFCPLCLYYENIMITAGSPPDRTGVVTYEGKYYWFCPDHISKFEDDPNKYLGSNIRHTLPCQMPKVVNLNEFPEDAFLSGYCPVCVAENLPGKFLNIGVISNAVELGQQIFLFDESGCMSQFMKKPALINKIPNTFTIKGLAPLDMQSLPTLGLLEQYVSTQVIKALVEIEAARPLIPGLTIQQSAVVCLGIVLKINNPNTPEKHVELYKEVKKKTIDEQLELKSMIDELKQTINPYLHYQEPLPPFKLDFSIYRTDSTDSKYIQHIIDSMLDRIDFEERVARALDSRSVPVPDERFDYLCDFHKPASKVPGFLNVVDIAGLVKGASEGQGLGNAFLSHISACDAIFHLCRAFEDDDVTHVEGDVNPVRDLEIIGEELRLKDEEVLLKKLESMERTVVRGNDKKLKPEYDALLKIKGVLVDQKQHIRFHDWSTTDIEVLNKHLFLTSKPAIYLVNLAEKDYIKKKNKWLVKIKEWIDKNDPGSLIIPFSGVFEHKLLEMDETEAKQYMEDNKTTSALDKIVVQGYKVLNLEYFFTAGPDEVKAWTVQKGTKAPQAAGRIHTDFEKGFIMAEVMKFVDFKEEGSEAAAKAAGKYRQQGRNYTVEDGDIIFFKFNAGAGLKDAKKK